MSNIFGGHGLTDSLLDAVRDVQNSDVAKHAAFGRTTRANITEAQNGDMPSKAHIMKMCEDGATEAEICKMHPDCDQDELKAMIKDCKGSMDEQISEKMSSKEKMAKGLYNGKMDPVGKADADIDNDGDEDKSDKYLHTRRKAIRKAMGGKKDTVEVNPKDKGDQ